MLDVKEQYEKFKDIVSFEDFGRDEVCFCCGKLFKSVTTHNYRQFCPSCDKEHTEHLDALNREYARLKAEVMQETALHIIESKTKDDICIADYKESIEAVRQMSLIKPDAFLSAHEVVAAIMLYDGGYFFKVNYPVLKYAVDFYMPDEKICFEVDGGFHDMPGTRRRDGRRDIAIRNKLGLEWEIVRIPTEYIERYPTKIPDAVVEMADKQRKMRRQFNGILPDGYSKTTSAYYRSLLKN